MPIWIGIKECRLILLKEQRCVSQKDRVVTPDLKGKTVTDDVIVSETCGTQCGLLEENYLAWDHPGIGRYLFFSALQGVIWFTLLLFAESGLASRLKQSIMMGTRTAQQSLQSHAQAWGGDNTGSSIALQLQTTLSHRVEEDSDVAKERERLLDADPDVARREHSLLLLNIEKWYVRRK